MHTRRQIIENQAKYRDEIIAALKAEMKALKKDLAGLDSKDKFIQDEREKLLKVSKKVKLNDHTFDSLFISHKNVYPRLYAWWDPDTQEVAKYKYVD